MLSIVFDNDSSMRATLQLNIQEPALILPSLILPQIGCVCVCEEINVVHVVRRG